MNGQGNDRAREPKVSRLLPDAEFIRRRLPIGEVVHKLGIQGNGRYHYCWKERHQRATVGVHLPSNTVRCFKCHARSLSPIDLVKEVYGLDVSETFRWFGREFPDLPRKRIVVKQTKGRFGRPQASKRYSRAHWPEVSCGTLATSEVWQSLRYPEQVLSMAVMAHVPNKRKDQPVIVTDYWELMRWSGIRNRRTLSSALKRLRELGLIQTVLVPTGRQTPRGFPTKQTLIRLTWFSTAWQVELGRADIWCPRPATTVLRETFDVSLAAGVPPPQTGGHPAAPTDRTATGQTVAEMPLSADDLRRWDTKGARLQ